MALLIGRNRNTNDEASVSTILVDSVTPVVISPANERRIHLRVDIAPGTTDRVVFIRAYPAVQDAIKQGELIVRRISGNDDLDQLHWLMLNDNIYTGEVSAICDTGTTEVYVTEW